MTVNEARPLNYFLLVLHSIECKDRERERERERDKVRESRLFERCTWLRKCSESHRPATWPGRREEHTGHSDAQEHVPTHFDAHLQLKLVCSNKSVL